MIQRRARGQWWREHSYVRCPNCRGRIDVEQVENPEPVMCSYCGTWVEIVPPRKREED